MTLFYLLIFFMPMTVHPILGRFVDEMTVNKYVGAACFVGAVLYSVKRDSHAYFLYTKQARWFLFLSLLVTVSFVLKSKRTDLESPLLVYVSFLALFFVTLTLVDSFARFRGVIFAAICGVSLASLYVIREWLQFRNVYYGFRPGYVVGDSNYFCVSALACLPITFTLLFVKGRPRSERLYCLGAIVVIISAFTVSASRGGFVGLIGASLFCILHSAHRARNLFVAATVLLAANLFISGSPLRRLLQPSSGDDQAVEHRTTVWRAGLRMIRENPLVGVGIGNFKPRILAYESPDDQYVSLAHNAYIELTAELRAPGIVAFLAVLVCSFASLDRVRRSAQRSGMLMLRQWALGMEAGVIGCSLSLMFVSGQTLKLFWLLLFLSMCLPVLAARAERTRRRMARLSAEGARPLRAG